MKTRSRQYVGVLGLTISLLSLSATGALQAASVDAIYGKLPLSFEANLGQADPAVGFVARGHGYNLLLTRTEAVLVLHRQNAVVALKGRELGGRKLRALTSQAERASVRVRMVGSDPASALSGAQLLPGKANYFIGQDRSKWRTDIPTYARVVQPGVYPGIDLVYYGNQRELEYDFVVAPGADPSQVRLAYEGVEGIEVQASGDLVLRTRLGEIRQHSPVVYQEIDGVIRKLPAAHVITGRNEVGFQVKDYDARRPLVIDPTVTFGTLLGGGADELGQSIAVDSSGSAYLCGATSSIDFPVIAGAAQGITYAYDFDVFVAKLNPTGTALVYSTFLGGSFDQSARAIAVDTAGNAYVGGWTISTDFPTTVGAFQPGTTDDCCQDAFVTVLNPAGSRLVYSTYLEGSNDEDLIGLAIDSSGNIYVTGWTYSYDFPVTAGAFQTTYGANGDAYVTKLNPSASGSASVVYSALLGGSGLDEGLDIAVDGSGSAYVTGDTASTNFPATPGAYRSPTAAGQDAFVVKVNPAGSALTYSALLGGGGSDTGWKVAVDTLGNAYVAGQTASADFPATPGAFQTTLWGAADAFVSKLNPAGSVLAYSTYAGGAGSDIPFGLALDSHGYAYVTGRTGSTDFPITSGALRSTLAGTSDAFVFQLNDTGSALLYSTYLGGNGDDEGDSIALDSSGNAYILGTTSSSDFSTTLGAYQATLRGASDAFVVKMTGFAVAPPPARSIKIVSGNNQSGAVNANLPSPLVVEVDDGGNPVANVTVTFSATNATVTSSSVQTDAAGRAQTPVKLGSTVGTATVTASAAGVATAVVFTATVTSGPPVGGIAVTSAASFAAPPVAPGMIAVVWSQTGSPDFTTVTQHAPSLPLPTSMGGVSVKILDSGGASRDVSLIDVSPKQLNVVVPDATQGGSATITVNRADGGVSTGAAVIESVAPGLFSATSDGKGKAVGQAIRVHADGSWTTADLSAPIDMGLDTDKTVLVVYGTGIRGRTSLVNVNATVGGQNVVVDFAGAQGTFVGLDQVNLQLPRSLRGQGDVSVSLTVDGKTANALTVTMAP